MHKLAAFLLGALVAVVGAAGAQTSGFPSRPRFQTVTAVTPVSGVTHAYSAESTLPGMKFVETDAAADNRLWRFRASSENFGLQACTDAGVCSGDIFIVERTGATIDSVAFPANTTAGGSLVCRADGTNCPAGVTQTSGNFVASFDTACTTTPTATYGYVQTGNTVTIKLKSTSGFACTGDSTSFATTGTPIPAAIRPTTNVISPMQHGCSNNAAGVACAVRLGSDGNIALFTVSASFALGVWAAAGNRNMMAGTEFTMTYYLTDP
jgi:hypothetical protein